MVVIETEIINKLGLHIRPASMIVQTASKYNSNLKLVKEDVEVDGKIMIEILTLDAGMGTIIKIITEGEDEEAAARAIEKLFLDKFEED
ncbi:HPr family phosphocarrier protein [bacterium]|nr:HPr family phosphocarrier protein [bacterium]